MTILGGRGKKQVCTVLHSIPGAGYQNLDVVVVSSFISRPAPDRSFASSLSTFGGRVPLASMKSYAQGGHRHLEGDREKSPQSPRFCFTVGEKNKVAAAGPPKACFHFH